MFLDTDGLHMKAREIRTHHRQKLRIIEEDPMVDIGEGVLLHGRLFRLPQSTVATVFIHMCADTTLCGSNVKLAARAGNSVNSTRRKRFERALQANGYFVGETRGSAEKNS